MDDNLQLQKLHLISMKSGQYKEPLTAISSTVIELKTMISLRNLDLKYLDEELDDIEKYVHIISNELDESKIIDMYNEKGYFRSLFFLLFEVSKIIKEQNGNIDFIYQFESNNLYLNNFDKIFDIVMKVAQENFPSSKKQLTVKIITKTLEDCVTIEIHNNLDDKLYAMIKLNSDEVVQIMESF